MGLILLLPITPPLNIMVLYLRLLLNRWDRFITGIPTRQPATEDTRPLITQRTPTTTQVPRLQGTTYIHQCLVKLRMTAPHYTGNATLIIRRSTAHNQRIPILPPTPNRPRSLIHTRTTRRRVGTREGDLTLRLKELISLSRRARPPIKLQRSIPLKSL